MNLKTFFTSLFTAPPQAPLVRIDGSLSGEAVLEEEGVLTRLKEVVRAVSDQRPYSYDLDLSAGRFNLILVEVVLPLSVFEPDPETALTRDLQNMLDALPPQHRTSVDSTFRALWHEGGEVAGVVFPVEPPGRIVAEKRIRAEQEYDRLAAEQEEQGYLAPRAPTLPRWATLALAAVVFAGGTYFIYHWSKNTPLTHLEAVMVEHVDLDGFEGLFLVEAPRIEAGRLAFTLVPNGVPDLEDPDPLKRLAAEALVKGRAQLEIFDPEGALLMTVPIDLNGFDGTEPVEVTTRVILLPSPPGAVKILP